MSEQWDVGRALALSGLFRLLQGAGRACAAPFLTLYLRHLGLPAPLVGAVAGARCLVAALWAPLCARCPRGRSKRRLLVAGCLLGSAGTSLLLTLVPPAGGAAGLPHCNGSRAPGGRGAATAGPAPGPGRYSVVGASAAANAKAVSEEAMETSAGAGTASRKPALASAASRGLSGLAGAAEEKGRGAGEGAAKTDGYWDGASGWATSVKAVNWETQEPAVPDSYRPPAAGPEEETGSLGSAAADRPDDAEENLYATENNELSVFKTALPAAGDPSVAGNLSDHPKDAHEITFEAAQTVFQDRVRGIFLMVLGAVVIWELLATALEWAVDENLYEYLDLVDATDRYSRLWIWGYLGASAGACGVAVLADQLSCPPSSAGGRLALHFYGYALLTTVSLLVTVFIPVHVPKKAAGVNKTAKALALLWGDGRAIVYAITVLVAGAAGSAVHNFLFWQMQDRGSSELYMGLSVTVALLAEILLYFFKGELLRTFSSSKIVVVSLSLLAAQLLCFSFLWTAWSVLLVQVLSAVSSGALWWVVNEVVEDVAAPGTARPLLALLRGLCHGGGASLGSFAGGFVVKRFGLAVLFRACCLCLVLWLCSFVVIQSRLPRQKKINYSRLLAADPSDVSDTGEESERDWLVTAMKDESCNRDWLQQRGIK